MLKPKISLRRSPAKNSSPLGIVAPKTHDGNVNILNVNAPSWKTTSSKPGLTASLLVCLDETRGRVLRRQRSSAGGGSVIVERRSNLLEIAGGGANAARGATLSPRFFCGGVNVLLSPPIVLQCKNPATVERPRHGN